MIIRKSQLFTNLHRPRIFIALAAAAVTTSATRQAAADNAAFGVCEHIAVPSSHMSSGEYTNRVAMLNYCAAAGIGMVRTDFRWRLCWSSGNSDWSWTYTDNAMADAERRGVEILPLLMGDNPVSGAKAYADLDNWAEFVRQVVTRYRGRISAVEVWNEWNHPTFWGGTVAQYARLLERTAAVIRAADPSIRVVMGGVAGDDLASIRALCREVAPGTFDVASFHPYCYPNSPTANSNWLARRIADLRTLLDDNGYASVPIWITEIGWPTLGDNAVTESQQAAYLTNAVDIAFAAGVEKVFPYELRAWGGAADGAEGSFGIVNADNSSRPALRAYRAYVRKRKTGAADPMANAVFLVGSDGWGVRSFADGAGWSDRRTPHPDADYLVDFGNHGILWTPSSTATFGGRSLTLGRVNDNAGNVRQIGWGTTATVADLRLAHGRWELTSGTGDSRETLAGAVTVLSPASAPFEISPAPQSADHAFTLAATLRGAALTALAFTEGETEADTLDATVSGDASAFTGQYVATGGRVTLRLASAALAGCGAAPRTDGVVFSNGATLAPLADGQMLATASRGFSSDGTAIIDVPEGWTFTLAVPLSGSFTKRGAGTLVLADGVSGTGGVVIEEGAVLPGSEAAAEHILSVAGGRVLGTLAEDSFESPATGTATSALHGWTGGGAVAAGTPALAAGTGWPLPDATHAKVLRLDGEAASHDYAASGSQERASLDMLVQVRRFKGDWRNVFATDDGDGQASVVFDSQGAPWLWHAGADSNPVWTRLVAKRPFANGDWVRVSFDFDYSTNQQGLAFVQVRLDGWCAISAAGWKTPSDPTRGGSWFRLPATASAPKTISQLSFEGALALDDLVLASRATSAPSPFGPERLVVPPTAIVIQ